MDGREDGPDRRTAATLVEVLVTIGIVALLAGLPLGGVQAARDTIDHVARVDWLRQRRLDEPQPRTALRILFVGNSHTFVNDIPGLVTGLGSRIDCRETPSPGWWSRHLPGTPSPWTCPRPRCHIEDDSRRLVR